MISPKDMLKIQIDITNACGNVCSNCTRFCGHHEKTFFMDFDTFKKAVDSLDGYDGIVGIIGGEPTLHPEFEKFADYMKEKRVHENVRHLRKPVHDMQSYIMNNMWHSDAKAGLWSSLTTGYYKYFETINDTFKTQLLNDHNNTCMHQALLMQRKELGIPDEEWIKKRDACWIQNTWSATITPKGAFFCEVAGSLDMLFRGPGGWPIEPGWWKRTPEEFADQLHWCEMCSGCLDVPQRISNDGRDDVTPQIYEKLLQLNSPKAKKDMCVVMKPEEYDKTKYHTFTGDNDYMELGNNQRTTKENRNLYPKNFEIITWKDLATVVENSYKDWVLVSDNPKQAILVRDRLSNLIINPGCLYIYEDVVAFNVNARSLRDKLDEIGTGNTNIWRYYPFDKIINISTLEKNMLLPELSELSCERKIAVYGAGLRGRELMSWLLQRKQHIMAWVDKNYETIGYPVETPECLNECQFDKVMVAIESEKIFKEIREYLINTGINEDIIVWVPYVQKMV